MRFLLNTRLSLWMFSLVFALSPCSAQPGGEVPNEQDPHEAANAARATDADSVGVPEFRKFLEQVLPRKGSFIAVYQPVSPKVFGRGTIGFDAATRAWFGVGWNEVGGGGRDSEGRDFVVGPRKGSAQPGEGITPQAPLGIESHFPSAVLYFLAAHPEAVRSAARSEAGVWSVSWQLADDLSGHQFPLAFIEVASDGIPVKRWQDDPSDRREETFEYTPNSPPGFPLLARVGPLNDRALVPTHIEYFAGGNLTPFSQVSVADTCYDNSVVVEMKYQATAAGIQIGDVGSEAASVPAPLPFTGRQWVRFRWPLVIAGVIIIVLAGIEVYRRRTG